MLSTIRRKPNKPPLSERYFDKRSIRVLIIISLHFMQKPIHQHKLLKSQIPIMVLALTQNRQYVLAELSYLPLFDFFNAGQVRQFQGPLHGQGADKRFGKD